MAVALVLHWCSHGAALRGLQPGIQASTKPGSALFPVFPCSELSGYLCLVRDNLNFYPAVQGTVLLGIVAGDSLGLAVTCGVQPVCLDALLDQVILYAISPFFRQGLVIGVAAGAVGVAFDAQQGFIVFG